MFILFSSLVQIAKADKDTREQAQEVMEKLKTSRWDSNLFYQWMEFSARQVTKDECIACYNTKRPPLIRPIPGSELNSCQSMWKCFAFCMLRMAGNEHATPRDMGDRTRCPERVDSEQLDDTFLPPTIQKPSNLRFPFCIVRGHALEMLTNRNARLWGPSNPNATDPTGKIKCGYEEYWDSHNKRQVQIKWCRTTPRSSLQCEQVVPAKGAVLFRYNGSAHDIKQYVVPSFILGSFPLADIFWICEGEGRVKTRLTPNWEGMCAPLMLAGKVAIIRSLKKTPKPARRRRALPITGPLQVKWMEDPNVYISAYQEPIGVPEEHWSMSKDTILAGQISGAFPGFGQAVNAYNLARNSKWVNYLWYNQQRFINFSLMSFDLVHEQLHATSSMAMQNRYIIETMLAPEQGVCDLIGEECCTVIPMHTGQEGNLTLVLDNMRKMRDTHVQHSNWNTRLTDIWGWLTSMSWTKILRAIGMLIGMILLVAILVLCCVFPLIKLLIGKLIKTVTGQFPICASHNTYISFDRPEEIPPIETKEPICEPPGVTLSEDFIIPSPSWEGTEEYVEMTPSQRSFLL